MTALDLAPLFAFRVSPLELIVRGSAVYWFLFVIFRLILRRNVGSIVIADVLVLVVIADAAQNAMSGGYDSVSEGFVLVATIIAWNVALDFMALSLRSAAPPARTPVAGARRQTAAAQSAPGIHDRGRVARADARERCRGSVAGEAGLHGERRQHPRHQERRLRRTPAVVLTHRLAPSTPA